MIWSSSPAILRLQPPLLTSNSSRSNLGLLLGTMNSSLKSLPPTKGPSRERGAFVSGHPMPDSQATRKITGILAYSSSTITSGIDSQLVELGLKRGAFQAEARSCAVRPAELTLSFAKCTQNLLALFVVERHTLFRLGLGVQFAERHLQDRSGSENYRALHKVFQLADIAWPRPLHQSLHGFCGNAEDGLVHPAGILPDKVLDQQWNVLPPLAQRW